MASKAISYGAGEALFPEFKPLELLLERKAEMSNRLVGS